jgi:predicted nuclease of predicted toxin-antitoxin system
VCQKPPNILKVGLDWPLLADENIHPDVVRGLAARGKNVRSIRERGIGLDDRDILSAAHAEGRVVLTHDADFGTLAVRVGEPYTGIIFLRPGHIASVFVLEILAEIDAVAPDVEAPFILVAERKADQVRLRLRR